jgi:hypothetical protein
MLPAEVEVTHFYGTVETMCKYNVHVDFDA